MANNYHDSTQDSLISQINADAVSTILWLEDTIQPSINLLLLRGLIYELLDDVSTFEGKKGVTELTEKSRLRIEKMIDYCEKLDKVANQNNTFQLIAKHTAIRETSLLVEIKRLKTLLEANKLAWDEL